MSAEERILGQAGRRGSLAGRPYALRVKAALRAAWERRKAPEPEPEPGPMPDAHVVAILETALEHHHPEVLSEVTDAYYDAVGRRPDRTCACLDCENDRRSGWADGYGYDMCRPCNKAGCSYVYASRGCRATVTR